MYSKKLFASIVCLLAFAFGAVLAFGQGPAVETGFKQNRERQEVVLLRPQIDGYLSDSVYPPMLVATATGVYRIPTGLRSPLGDAAPGTCVNNLSPEVVQRWPRLSTAETESVRKLLSARKAGMVKSELSDQAAPLDLAAVEEIEAVDAALAFMPKEEKNFALLLVGGWKVRDLIPTPVQLQYERGLAPSVKVTMSGN